MSIADNLTLSKLTDLGPRGLVLRGRQNAVAAAWMQKLDIKARVDEAARSAVTASK